MNFRYMYFCRILFFCLFFSVLPVFSDDVEVYEVSSDDEIESYEDSDSDEEFESEDDSGSYSDDEEFSDSTDDSIDKNRLDSVRNRKPQEYPVAEAFQRAKTFYRNRELETAIDELKSIIRRDNRHQAAYELLATIYSEREEYERQSATCQLLYKMLPTEKNKLLLNSSLSKFLNQLKKFRLQHPAESMIPAKIGEIYYKMGDVSSAEAACNEALQLKNETPKAHYILTLIALEKKDTEAAYSHISAAFRFEPESQEYFKLLNQVSRLREKEEQKKPKPQVKETIDSVHYTNALQCIEKKDYVQALNLLKKTLESYPSNSELIQKLGEVKKLVEDQSAATLEFNLATKFFEEKKYDRALEKLEGIQKNNWESMLDFLGFNIILLKTYFEMNRFNECVKISNRLLEQIPTSSEPHYYAGLSAEKLGNREIAYSHFTKAHNLTLDLAKHPEIRKELSRKIFYYDLRNSLWLIILFLVLLAASVAGGIYAYNLVPFRKKRYIRRLEKAYTERKFREISDLFHKLDKLPLTPMESRTVNMVWSESCFLQNSFEKALTSLKNVIKIDPNDNQAHTMMAKIFLKKEIITDESLYEYARLVKKEPSNPELSRLLIRFFNSAGEKLFDKWYKIFGGDLQIILENCYKIDPSNTEMLRLWTILSLRENKNDDRSREIYEKYLENTRDEKLEAVIKPLLFKGFYGMQKYDRAFNLGLELLEILPQDRELFMILNDICEHEEKIPWLLTHLERLMQKFPGKPVYRDYISQLREKIRLRENRIVENSDQKSSDLSGDEVKKLFEDGKELFKNGEINQAIAFFRKCFKLTDDQFLKLRSSKLLILSYLRKGLFDLAREQYKLTEFDEIAMSPDLKELCYLMGEAYEKAGMYQDAFAMYEKICISDVGYRDVFDRNERIRSYLEKNENL